MTQVSKYKLRLNLEERIYELLSNTLAGIKNSTDFKIFLNDFLSPTERTVLAKRLAIAALIEKGNDYRQICQILRVTPTTISKVAFRMKYGNGSIKKISENIAVLDDNKALLEELGSIFDLPVKGLPISEYTKKVQKRSQVINRLKKEL